MILSPTMVVALRAYGDEWAVDRTGTTEGTVLALEAREVVEFELRPRDDRPRVIDRWARRTDAGRRYLKTLDDLSRVQA